MPVGKDDWSGSLPFWRVISSSSGTNSRPTIVETDDRGRVYFEKALHEAVGLVQGIAIQQLFDPECWSIEELKAAALEEPRRQAGEHVGRD